MLFSLFGLSSFVGVFEQLLKILNTLLTSVSPALSSLLEGLVWLLKKVGVVILQGLRDILKSWPAITTIALAFSILWGGMRVSYDSRIDNRQNAINECYRELSKHRKKITPPTAESRFPSIWDILK